MKSRFELLVLVALVVISLARCGNKNQQPVEEENADSTYVDLFRDHTLYGICGDGTAMNSLQLLTDSGDTLMLSLLQARDSNKVYGGLAVGDRMAVMANEDQTTATLVINQSTLMGDWVMPNPLDGSSVVGISLKEGGVAESIEQTSVIYKSWKIFDGHLVLTSVREGGGDEEETLTYDLVTLGADSLVFKDAEDTFEYARNRPGAVNLDEETNIEDLY